MTRRSGVAQPTASVALTFARAGWKLWPDRPRSRRPYNVSKVSNDNVTETVWRWDGPSSDPHVVAAWWARWPHANVGAMVPDHLVVVDIDPRNGATLTPDDLDETMTVRTGGGGWHLYLRRPNSDLAMHSSAWPGVEMLVGGTGSGRVLLPPSLHRSGTHYVWERRTRPAAMPSWLATAFTRRPRPVPQTFSGPVGDGSALVAKLTDVIGSDLATAPAGQVHDTLLRVARFAGKVVGGGHLDRDRAVDMLLAAVPDHGHRDERADRRTIHDGLDHGSATPYT